jgi:FkbM family methyltransferase
MADLIRLIDVGARGGIDRRWEPHQALMDVLAFEADPRECASLNSKRHPNSIRFLPVALGAVDGQLATLFVGKEPGCSSLLRPNMELGSGYPYGELMKTVSEYPITTKRLDTACGDFQPNVNGRHAGPGA